MSWIHWYRVDTVPKRWWPIYVPASYAFAAGMWLYIRLARATCRIDREGGRASPRAAVHLGTVARARLAFLDLAR